MGAAIFVISQGWHITDPELWKLLNVKTKLTAIKKLTDIGCPIRAGQYIKADEFWSCTDQEPSIEHYEALSDSAKRLKA